jgi:RNA polymerase sigma factor (TIGR02999 family)
MNDASSQSIGRLLDAVDNGEPGAFDRLVAAVYPDLKRIAHFQMSKEMDGHTLNTTAIVHEAFLQMAGGSGRWETRQHFMRAASKVMRHLLVDHARRRNSKKRGDGVRAATLQESIVPGVDNSMAVLALENALQGIREIDPALESVIECRFFAGLSVKETAAAMDTPVRTVERLWQRARGYLVSELQAEE